MSCTREMFGIMPDGRKAERYILKNESGVTASFTNLGGIWLTMLVPDKNGVFKDVVLGSDTVKKCMANEGHFGEIVGRNANRIGNALFTLSGKEYSLERNSGPNNLHSGPDYYRDRLWNTEVGETERGTRISFSLFSPDGDQGYPGNAEILVSYTLTPDNRLMIEYLMTADADTIANFTNHAYFNLAGHASKTTMEQQVWIDADYFTVADQVSIPTGELVPVKGTPMDFTVMKPIGCDMDADYEQLHFGGGYDHNWVLNHKPHELVLSAKAMDKESGRVMEIYTDLPGIQFYTGNYINNVEGKDGVIYEKRQGYCFETQHFPDAINKPQFPSPILKVGDEYRTTTVYRFSTIS